MSLLNFFRRPKFSKYGWNPDLPDHRDFEADHAPTTQPRKVDLREAGFLPPVWNQGELGSCVAHASGAAYMFCQAKNNQEYWMPSRLFLYYNARDLENSTQSDDGCQIRDSIKTLNSMGVCDESLWPYLPSKFSQKPPKACYDKGDTEELTKYARVEQTASGLQKALAAGYPVVLGIALFESFESESVSRTGIVSLPNPSEKSLGGHAVLVVGYDSRKKVFIVRNSWGTEWGQQGYFTIPYDYILNNDLTDDLWTLQAVE